MRAPRWLASRDVERRAHLLGVQPSTSRMRMTVCWVSGSSEIARIATRDHLGILRARSSAALRGQELPPAADTARGGHGSARGRRPAPSSSGASEANGTVPPRACRVLAWLTRIEGPRLQRRAALEALEALDDPEPGLLHDLLGHRAVLHVGAGHREHRAVEAGDESHERLLVAGTETLEERGLGGGGIRALEGDLGHARRTYRRDMAAVERTHAAVTSTSTRPACTGGDVGRHRAGVEPGLGQSLRELVVRRDVDAPDAVLVGRDLVAVDVADAAAALLTGVGGEAAHCVGGRAGRTGVGADRNGLAGVGADVIGAMVICHPAADDADAGAGHPRRRAAAARRRRPRRGVA